VSALRITLDLPGIFVHATGIEAGDGGRSSTAAISAAAPRLKAAE
jgi:hypothetical protein